jgi:hypothetical protein
VVSSKKKQEVKEVKQEVKRVYKGDATVYTDLFKLEVAYFKRKTSLDSEKGIKRPVTYEDTEHCHYFHTYDSNGKKMVKCNAVGGHTHEVSIKEVDGKFVCKCSQPISVDSKKKKFISFQNGADKHTHKITYIESEKVEVRRKSKLAQNAIDNYKNDIPEREKEVFEKEFGRPVSDEDFHHVES